MLHNFVILYFNDIFKRVCNFKLLNDKLPKIYRQKVILTPKKNQTTVTRFASKQLLINDINQVCNRNDHTSFNKPCFFLIKRVCLSIYKCTGRKNLKIKALFMEYNCASSVSQESGAVHHIHMTRC